MKAIRAAEWYNPDAPAGACKASPHADPVGRAVRPVRSASRLRGHARGGAARPRRDRRLRPRARRGRHPPDAPAGRGRRLVPSPGRRLGRRARHRGAHPGAAPRAGVPRRSWRRSRPTAARSSRTARWCRGRPWTSPGTAGSTCTSRCCPPGGARRRCSTPCCTGTTMTGAACSCSRRAWTPGPVFGTLTEPIRPTDTAGDLLDRLAVAGAGLLVATPRRHRGRHARAPCRSRPRASPSPRRSPSRTPGSLGATRRSPSTGGSAACTPAPGAWTTFRGERLKLGPVAPSVAGRRRTLAPGELRRRARPGAASAPAPTPVVLGDGQAAGQEGHAGRRLGARRARIEPGTASADHARPAGHPGRPGAARTRRPAGARDDGAGRPPRGRAARRCDPARRAAYEAVAAVHRDDAYANLVLPEAAARAGAHRPGRRVRDRAGLRHAARGPAPSTRSSPPPRDRAVDAHRPARARRAAARGVPAAQHARPPHAAVSSTVDLVRARGARRPAGFANAVLRRVAEPRPGRVAGRAGPRRATPTRVGHLAWPTRTRSGSCGRSPTRSAATSTRPSALLDADNERPAGAPVRAARPDRPGRARRRGRAARPRALLAVRGRAAPAATPGAHARGRATAGPHVQDEGSQLVALALRRGAASTGRDERWLDLCAGPGGKAGLLGALAADAGRARDRRRGRRRTGPSWSPRPPAGCRSTRARRRRARRSPRTGAARGRLRPGAGRRAVHRAGRAAPPPGGALAPRSRRTCRR